MDADLDTLATALYVTTDDLLRMAPWRPAIGVSPPVGFALTKVKADERTVLLDILHTDPTLSPPRPGQIIIGDKNYVGAEFETTLTEAGLTLLRPAHKGEPDRAGSRFFKPLHQTIESIFDTYQGQLNWHLRRLP